MTLCVMCGDEGQPTLNDLCPKCTMAVFWNSQGHDKPMKLREIMKLKRHKAAHPDEAEQCDQAMADIRHSMPGKQHHHRWV